MKTFLLAALGAVSLLAQAPPEFEVASVRPSSPSQDRVDIGMHLDGAQVRISSLPFRDLVAMAYRVKGYQVNGPDNGLFDINAKLPDGAKSDQIPEMLQALLAQRFQLQIHRETKELPVYALIQGKPPLKLQRSASDGAEPARPGVVNASASGSADGVAVSLGPGSSYTYIQGKFEFHKVSMDMLARQIERYVDRPILNLTGLEGNYDASFSVSPEDAPILLIRAAVNAGVTLPPQALQAMDNGSFASLFDAFEKLGLKLDARKAPMEMIVIDHSSKTASEN